MPDQVKRDRQQALLAAQEQVDTERRSSLVGSKVEVLLEGENTGDASAGRFRGRTRSNDIVIFHGPDAPPGTLCAVLLESATALTLFGRRV